MRTMPALMIAPINLPHASVQPEAKYRGLSTALRFGRDDGDGNGDVLVEMMASGNGDVLVEMTESGDGDALIKMTAVWENAN